MRAALFGLILLVVPACTLTDVTPQTPREGLVVAEVAYTTSLATIKDAATKGYITKDEVPAIRKYMAAASASLDRARALIQAAEMDPTNQQAQTDAQVAVNTAKALVDELANFLRPLKGAP